MSAMEFEVSTTDGVLPVRAFQAAGRKPGGGVLFYMDAFGLRPELDRMCARYADSGYTVLLPDLYYRLGCLRFEPPRQAGVALDPAVTEANLATTVEMTIGDSGALLDWAADRFGLARFGAVGYCMGARHALGAAASYSDRIRAVACLHGGRLVWDGSNSPHLYIPRISGGVYFAFAERDETCPDEHKALIERTIAESGVRGTTEHFRARHGWTFPERYCYDEDTAERAWARVIALFDAELAVALP